MYMHDFIMAAEGNRVTVLHNTNTLRKVPKFMYFWKTNKKNRNNTYVHEEQD